MSAVTRPSPAAPRLLSRAAIVDLDPARRPLVDQRDLRPRIVHFGFGAFHRAHQAVYPEAAAAATGEPWGIAGIAPRSHDTVAATRAQAGLYSVTELDPHRRRTRVVGALVEALHLRADGARIGQLVASPDVPERLRMANAVAAAVCGAAGDWEGLPDRDDLVAPAAAEEVVR